MTNTTSPSEMIKIENDDFFKCFDFFKTVHHNTCFYIPKDWTLQQFLDEMETPADIWNLGLDVQKLGHKLDNKEGDGEKYHEFAGELFNEAMEFIEKIEKRPE